jgi:hypothetical protein
VAFNVEQTIFEITGLECLPSYPISIVPCLKYAEIDNTRS